MELELDESTYQNDKITSNIAFKTSQKSIACDIKYLSTLEYILYPILRYK